MVGRLFNRPGKPQHEFPRNLAQAINPPVRAVQVVGQAVNRARRRPDVSVIQLHPVRLAPNKLAGTRAVQVLTAVELAKARIKRFTAKSKLTHTFGRTTKAATVRAIKVAGQAVARAKLRVRLDVTVQRIKPVRATPAVVAIPVPVTVVCSARKRQAVGIRLKHGVVKLGKAKPSLNVQILPAPTRIVCAARKRLTVDRRIRRGKVQETQPVKVANPVLISIFPAPTNVVCAARKRRVWQLRSKSSAQLHHPGGGIVAPVPPVDIAAPIGHPVGGIYYVKKRWKNSAERLRRLLDGEESKVAPVPPAEPEALGVRKVAPTSVVQRATPNNLRLLAEKLAAAQKALEARAAELQAELDEEEELILLLVASNAFTRLPL